MSCALFQEIPETKHKGASSKTGAKYREYHCSISPGVDPVFMICLCCICDAFDETAHKMGWEMYPAHSSVPTEKPVEKASLTNRTVSWTASVSGGEEEA
jgi:hypothetical protein